MKTALMTIATIAALAAPIRAEQTWTGQISDSACGKKHEEAAEGQGKMPDRECTLACVRGGSQYVFVADGKIYRLADQRNAKLAAHAGETVKITGELKGGAITVSKIETVR